MVTFLMEDDSTSQDLSAAVLDYSLTITKDCKLGQVSIHASVAITETVRVDLDSALGANYDALLAKRSMVAEQDFVFRPDGDISLQAGDKIRVQCTDANGTGTVYVVIKRRELEN